MYRLLSAILVCSLPVLLPAQRQPLSLAQRTALADSARVLHGQDSLDRVIDLFDRVIYASDGEMVADSLSGELLRHKARILRRPLRRVEETLATLRERIRWVEAQPDAPATDLMVAHQYLGSVAFFESDFATSREALMRADAIARQTPDVNYFTWLDALRLLCNVAADDYDSDLVRSVTRRATAMYDQHVEYSDHPRRQLLGREVYLDAADARGRIGDDRKALAYARRGLEIAREFGGLPGIIRSLSLLASCEEEVGLRESAKARYYEAIRLHEADPGQAGEINYIYNNLALSLQADGRDAEARTMFQRSLSTMQPQRYAEAKPGGLSDLALSEARLGNPETADSLYWEAVQMISSGNTYERGGETLAVADSVNLLYELLTVYESRLETNLALRRPEQALASAVEIMDIQDRLRAGVLTEGSRRFNSELNRRVLDAAVRLCHEQFVRTGEEDYLWSALGFSERARAYSLMFALHRNQIVLPVAERELRTRIAALERRPDRDTAALAELDRARLDLSRLVSAEADAAPERQFDRDALLSWLAAHETTLITYHLAEKTRLCFRLAPDGQLSVAALDTTADVGQLVEEWRNTIMAGSYRAKSLRSPDVQGRLDDDFLRRGEELVRLLFPVGLPPQGPLCVVPDGPLHFLPFGALPVGIPQERPLAYREVEYLADRRPLHLAYTTELLLRSDPPAVNERISFLGLAPSFRGATDVLAVNDVRGAADYDASRGLPALTPLANNREEVTDVASFFSDPLTYLGDEATRANFLADARRAAVLHLSTHGVVDSDDPNLSFVAFAQQGDSLYDNDLLYYNDLASLPLSADLVVLAACETSLGQLAPGETALSMASAFTAAGARGTLTTLWQVSDAATRELMVAFYDKLAEGRDRATALTAAQAELRAGGDYAHPYYWSGLTLHGVTEPVAFSAGRQVAPRWLYLLAVAALGGMLWYAFRDWGK